MAPAYLFDANAVVEFLDAAEYDPLFGEATLALMFYEVTNVLWKHAAYRQEISREVGAGLAAQLDGLRSEMHVYGLADLAATHVYQAAWDFSLSAYDAAYVVAAEEFDLTLVTSDNGIHENAPEGVTIILPDEIE